MIAKIQLKLNNDVLLTVIKMVKHTDDYIVENVTDALLISIKEDLINKLEDKAKTIQKQVSILDHNKKHSLVLKYHEAYSLFKLLDAVYEKQLFSNNLHIKKIKRLITELNNKLDIFAKEEDVTIIDEEPQDYMLQEEYMETLPAARILVAENDSNTASINSEQIEMPMLFDMTDAFKDEDDTTLTEVVNTDAPLVVNELTETILTTEVEENTAFSTESITPSTEELNLLLDEDIPVELEQNTSIMNDIVITTENNALETSETETFPTQETIYNTEELFMPITPVSQPKLDWERITTEDSVDTDNKKTIGEKVSFTNPKYNELFNIAKTGINVDKDDLVPTTDAQDVTTKTTLDADEVATDSSTEEDFTPNKDVMQIEIFDMETIEADAVEVKPKKEKKKEKKIVQAEQAGQISLF